MLGLVGSIVGWSAFLSTVLVIIYTLQQILNSVLGVEFYYNIRFYIEFLFAELKTYFRVLCGHLKKPEIKNG